MGQLFSINDAKKRRDHYGIFSTSILDWLVCYRIDWSWKTGANALSSNFSIAFHKKLIDAMDR
jgi:hypothetical protein